MKFVERRALMCNVVKDTLDMCETSSGYYVLEIGCLSCAGLYDCNRKEVVRAIRETLLRENI